MKTLGNGETTAEEVHLLLIDVVRAAFSDDAACSHVVEVVKVLCRVMAHLVDIDFHQGFYGLALQADIIIIGGTDNGQFGLRINHALLQAFGERAALFVDALLVADSAFAMFVKGAIL